MKLCDTCTGSAFRRLVRLLCRNSNHPSSEGTFLISTPKPPSAHRWIEAKIPALTEALTGRFTSHYAFLARVHLDLIDQHTAAIDEITMRIEEESHPFTDFAT